MKIILSTVLLALILSINVEQISAQNWFPLEVGNSWQYFSHTGYSSITGGSSQHYSLSIYSIISDTSINTTKYYKWSRFPNAWIRFDSSEQKLYQYCDSLESIIMDFNLDIDSIAYCTHYSCFQDDCTIIEDIITFGDSTIYLKGYFRFYYFITEYYYYDYFSTGLGPVKYSSTLYSSGSSSGFSNIIVQAKINNINYSYTYNPEIVIVPCTVISDSIFNLTFDVEHHYNRIFPPPTPNTSLNFIDTVKMYSFYSRGYEIIENPVVYANSLSGTASWKISTILNLDLLKDDYKLKYRIEAIDKGMLPHRTFAPDTGYYELVFDSTTSVDQLSDILHTFLLYQNHPNPFNPSTVIGYQLPVSGEVTLKVFDILGREVATLVDEFREAGYHEVELHPASGIGNLASGIYFYQLSATGGAGSFIATKKMMVIR